MKQIIKHKTVGIAFSSTEKAKENASDMARPVRQKLSEIFSTTVEKFYSRIKFFGGTIFSCQVWQCKTMMYTKHGQFVCLVES